MFSSLPIIIFSTELVGGGTVPIAGVVENLPSILVVCLSVICTGQIKKSNCCMYDTVHAYEVYEASLEVK